MKKNSLLSYNYTIPSDIVIAAYKKGLFPMAETSLSKEIYWLDPKKRGIIFFDKVKIPKKTKKFLKSNPFQVAVDLNFEEVIECCSKITEKREDTWINKTIKNIYVGLHKEGYAHSVECYLNKELVGGLYGVAIGSVFFGESMFSFVSNASKCALIHLIERLIIGNFHFLDTQFINDHLKQFGACEISNNDFKKILYKAIEVPANFEKFYKTGFIPKKLYPLVNRIIIN